MSGPTVRASGTAGVAALGAAVGSVSAVALADTGAIPARSALAHLALTMPANRAQRVAVLDSGSAVRIVPLAP